MRWKWLKKKLLLLLADASTAPSAAAVTIFTGFFFLSLFVAKLPGSGGTLDTNFRHRTFSSFVFCFYFPSLRPFWLWRAHRHFDTVEIFFSKFNPSGAQFCFTERHCTSPPIRTLAEKHPRRPTESKKSRKTRKLCNLELFSCVHTPNLFSFSILEPHDIGKKFLSLPARQCKCVLCWSFPTIHPLSKVFLLVRWKVRSNVPGTCAVREQQNNPGELPQYLFLYRDVHEHESRSQFGAHEMGKLCVASTRPFWMCEGGNSGEKIMWKFAARFTLFGRSSLARASLTPPPRTHSPIARLIRSKKTRVLLCKARDIVWTLFSSWDELSPPLNKFRSDTDSLLPPAVSSRSSWSLLSTRARAFRRCAFPTLRPLVPPHLHWNSHFRHSGQANYH